MMQENRRNLKGLGCMEEMNRGMSNCKNDKQKSREVCCTVTRMVAKRERVFWGRFGGWFCF